MHQGVVILTVPFFWHIHEAPRDFYRYSEYWLRHLFEQAGFEIVEIQPLTGFIVTFSQLSIYFLRRFQRGYLLRTIGRILNWGLQYLALTLNRYDRSTDFTNLYGLVARKTLEVHPWTGSSVRQAPKFPGPIWLLREKNAEWSSRCSTEIGHPTR